MIGKVLALIRLTICTLSNISFIISGNEVSIYDYYIWPFVRRFVMLNEIFNKKIFDEKRCPKLHAWMLAMADTPGAQGITVTINEMTPFYIGIMNSKRDYDHAL